MNSVQKNSSSGFLTAFGIFLLVLLGIALISTFSGWVNGVYSVPNEQIYMVLGNNMKGAMAFGSAMTIFMIFLARSTSRLDQLIGAVAMFTVSTLIVPVTAYIGWLIWHWMLHFTGLKTSVYNKAPIAHALGALKFLYFYYRFFARSSTSSILICSTKSGTWETRIIAPL